MGPRTQAASITVFSLQLDVLHKYYIMTIWQLQAEHVKQLFFTIVCSLIMGQRDSKEVEAGVL